MIDLDWFAQICCLAQPDLAGVDRAQLCKELGVQEEVLPYLLIAMRGFGDWPQARKALRGAVRAVPRPSSAKVRPQFDPQTARLRRDMREAIDAVLREHGSAPQSERGNACRSNAAGLIAHHDAAASVETGNPASFIATE